MTEKYTVQDVFTIGLNHGRNLFDYNANTVPDYQLVIDKNTDEDFDAEQFADNIRVLCWDADEGYRQYSPFEFFAHALNEDEDSEELWESYESGISEGIDEGIEELTAHLYMTTAEAHKVIEQWKQNQEGGA